MALREIYTAYSVQFPKIEGKKFRAFYVEGTSDVVVEVTANGATEPEWSAEGRRLEGLVARTNKQYGLAAVAAEPGGTGGTGGDAR